MHWVHFPWCESNRTRSLSTKSLCHTWWLDGFLAILIQVKNNKGRASLWMSKNEMNMKQFQVWPKIWTKKFSANGLVFEFFLALTVIVVKTCSWKMLDMIPTHGGRVNPWTPLAWSLVWVETVGYVFPDIIVQIQQKLIDPISFWRCWLFTFWDIPAIKWARFARPTSPGHFVKPTFADTD